MRGLRQAALLVRPTVRSLSWAPLAAAGALAFGLLGLTDQGLTELRLAAIGICVGVAFILDDAAAATVASAPTPLLVRRALRVGLATAPLAALWALLSWLAGGAASWAMSLELAAMLALTLAAAAVATRLRGAGRGGAAAGPALLVLLSAAYLLLPSRWGPLPRRPTGSALDGGTSTLGPDPARRRARRPLGRAATPPGALWALGSFAGASLEWPRAIPEAATEQSENSHRPPRRRCPAALPIHEERTPGRMTDHPNADRAPERTQIVVMSFPEGEIPGMRTRL